MRNRLVFLFMMSTTWACVFISEPDVGASGEFDFFPEDPSGQQAGATLDGNDAGILGSNAPEINCQRDDVTRCQAADSGVDASSSESSTDLDLAEDGLQAVPKGGTANDIPMIPLDDEDAEDETDDEDPTALQGTEGDDEANEDEETVSEDDDAPPPVSESGEESIDNATVSDDPCSDDH